MTAITTLLSALTDGTVRVVDLSTQAPADGLEPEGTDVFHPRLYPGTHLVVRGKRGAEPLIGQAVVLDFAAEVTAEPDFQLTRDHVLEWEARHGGLPRDGWLLYRTGWGQYAQDAVAYLNADEEGAHTPGIAAECVQWLAEERSLAGIGVETASLDAGQPADGAHPEPVRKLLLGAGTAGLTSLRGLDRLPTVGAALVVAPSTQARKAVPARVFALVQDELGQEPVRRDGE